MELGWEGDRGVLLEIRGALGCIQYKYVVSL